MVELIGIVAAGLILVSMIFPTMSFKGSVCMRILNMIGSIVFVVYGVMLPAIATAIANIGILIVNAVHLFVLIKNKNQPQIDTDKNE